MSVMHDVIQEEYNRLCALIEQYEKKIESFPRGSLQKRNRGEKSYYYLAYRGKEDKRVEDRILERLNLMKQTVIKI